MRILNKMLGLVFVPAIRDGNPDKRYPMPILREHRLEIRVRYQETDGQGRLHHANFLNYFEVARVDMLRASGISYRDLEQAGTMLVVAELQCHYHQAAFFDDLLTVEIHLEELKGVRIRHRYRVYRGTALLATGHTVVAAVNRDGKVVRLPNWLREMKPSRRDQGLGDEGLCEAPDNEAPDNE